MNKRNIKVEKVSSVIETEPYGYEDQPRFLNAVCIAQTPLSPHELLNTLLQIERNMGRVKRYGGDPGSSISTSYSMKILFSAKKTS
jgi:2-amino-4-hydroxy-6-hydroxymethyldihydropteridine diphosphokinase